jgi:AAA-like domain
MMFPAAMSQVSISETDHSDRQICEWVDEWFMVVHQRHLSDVELQVLQGAWRGKTYDAIAAESYLTVKYVSEVGGRLWQMLSQVLNEEVKKSNFRPALLRYAQKTVQKTTKKNGGNASQNENRTSNPSITPQIPVQPASLKPMPNTFPLIDRPPLESCCYGEIDRSGALLRLKSPLQGGKTTLMSKVLHYAEQQQYRTVIINLRDAVSEDFVSLDRFLIWFLEVISQAIGLNTPIANHWKTSLGNSKIKCRTFLEKNVLNLNFPLVIAIDELDRIFAYPGIAGEFLGMLRTWHEDAKTKPLWGFVRFMVLYTEIYTQLDINQSPFNAGVEFCLQDFDRPQVLQLAQAYGLDWADEATDESVDRLMDWVGGQPYLVTQALKSIAQSSCTLAQLLDSSTAPNSIYRSHLERQWHLVQSQPQLQTFLIHLLRQELSLKTGDQIELAVKLYDVGIIQLTQSEGTQQAKFCYRLYEQYFSERLGGRE